MLLPFILYNLRLFVQAGIKKKKQAITDEKKRKIGAETKLGIAHL